MILLLTALSKITVAQQSPDKRDFSAYPYWIEMMDDTLTNYFTAIQAYDTFWKDLIKPADEEEVMGMKGASREEEKDKQSWLSKLFKKKPEKESQQYVYQCKRFEYWKMKMEPWVQPDGRILYPTERLLLFEKARQ